MSLDPTASNENTPPALRMAGNSLRLVLGWATGSILSVLTLIPPTVIILAFTSDNNTSRSLAATTATTFVTVLIGLVFIGGAILAFRFAGKLSAAYGPLLFGPVFILIGLTGLFRVATDPQSSGLPMMGAAIAGLIFSVVGLAQWRRVREDGLTGPFDSGWIVLNSALARKMVKSRLADRLQTPLIRRAIVTLYVAVILALTTTLMFAAIVDGQTVANIDEFVTANLQPLRAALLAGLMIAGIGIEQLLFIIVRPVLALPGTQLDERQLELVQSANADTRLVLTAFILLLGGLGTLGAPAAVIGITTLSILLLTYAAPKLILAWILPAENDAMDDDDDFIASGELV